MENNCFAMVTQIIIRWIVLSFFVIIFLFIKQRNCRVFSLKGVTLCERAFICDQLECTHPLTVSCEVELIDDIALLRENEPAFV